MECNHRLVNLIIDYELLGIMKLSDFDYNLPKNLIAQEPVRPRDHSRLLVVNKGTESLSVRGSVPSVKIEHKHFYDLVDYLKAGDVLVLNNSKVFPARLIGKRKTTGGKIEIFLLPSLPAPLPLRSWRERGAKRIGQCLIGGRRVRVGLEIEFCSSGGSRPVLKCEVIKNNNDGTWQVKFNKSDNELMRIVEKIGQAPLPPYIKRDGINPISSRKSDFMDYQTIYADNKKIGSVAAPTAGFHFTPALIKKLKIKGVEFEYITLHVGLGTFAPVKVDNIKKHKMHAEYVEIEKEVAERILKAKKEKRRIIAVGTTSARTLEGCLAGDIAKSARQITNYKLPITLFIYPGFKFKIVDAMITNFHLPKSTLLMLISAFAGKKNIDKAYKKAIRKKYRFYSYGDAMLIL